jgi:hypothetical protein
LRALAHPAVAASAAPLTDELEGTSSHVVTGASSVGAGRGARKDMGYCTSTRRIGLRARLAVVCGKAIISGNRQNRWKGRERG